MTHYPSSIYHQRPSPGINSLKKARPSVSQTYTTNTPPHEISSRAHQPTQQTVRPPTASPQKVFKSQRTRNARVARCHPQVSCISTQEQPTPRTLTLPAAAPPPHENPTFYSAGSSTSCSRSNTIRPTVPAPQTPAHPAPCRLTHYSPLLRQCRARVRTHHSSHAPCPHETRAAVPSPACRTSVHLPYEISPGVLVSCRSAGEEAVYLPRYQCVCVSTPRPSSSSVQPSPCLVRSIASAATVGPIGQR